LLLLLFSFYLIFPVCLCAQNSDIDLLKQINLGRNKNLDPAFRFVSNSAAPIGLIVPLSLFSVALFEKDSTMRMNGLFIAESEFAAVALTEILKYSVKRPRPFITYPFIEKETEGGDYSFPSGHTSDAFATATALSLAYPRWYVIAPSFLWAGTVAWSRMDLGVHYPSDVVAGALVGSGCTLLCSYLNKKWRILNRVGNFHLN
jgi:membrane-associated phospholipid phosphatase